MAGRPEPLIHAFGDFELDESLYELRAAGAAIKVEPKVFDVLAYLVRHRDRVVPKEELLERLWPGEFVSESVLPRCITAARRAVGDDPSDQRVIQTVHGRGYRFVAPMRTPGALSAPDPGSGRDARVFVGRAEAMAALEAALGQAVAGRGRLVLLAGEPGIGKTRTAEELASVARGRGAGVATGACWEGEGAPAFWPWTQILRTCVADGGRSALQAIGPAAGDLAQLIPGLAADGGETLLPTPATPSAASALAPGPAAGVEQARFRLFDAVSSFFRHLSAMGPLVLVLDDVHWADKPSLLLLQFLAREMRDSALLVLATYRDVALRRQHPLAEALGELARQPVCQRVVLRGLAEADVARFIELTIGRPPGERVATAVHEMTEGNPFFIGEIVRLLAVDGRLERPADGSALAIALPQGVREAIGRRLNALSEEANRLLSLASVIGREFRLNVLREVADLPAERVLELLDEAVAARIVYPPPSPAGAYAFSHALIRETLAEELAVPTRVRFHRQVGEVLERVHAADLTPHLANLAHHFFEAAPGGDARKAIAYARRAAERALDLLAYEEATGHYQRALEAMDAGGEPDEAGRCELLLGLGDARSRSGERNAARATFERAAAIARGLGRRDLLARAALGFGGRGEFGAGRDTELQALLEEALSSLGPDDVALRARLLARMTGLDPFSASMETRDRLSSESVDLARRARDPATLLAALSARGWALLGPDRVLERDVAAGEILRLAAETRDRSCAFLGHEFRLGVLLALGDMPGADREIETMAQLADELRLPAERLIVGWARASRAMGDGRFADAGRLLEESAAIGRRVQHPSFLDAYSGQKLWLRGEQGLLETTGESEVAFDGLLERLATSRALLRAGLASLYFDVGRVEEARAELDALAAGGFTQVARDEHWLVTMSMISELCADMGDAPRAALVYDLLLPFEERNVVHDLIRTYRGAVTQYLGLLARTVGRFTDAARHFEDALARNARMNARPYLVRTQIEYARLLLAEGKRRDQARARSLLAEAVAAAREMGMPRIVARGLALVDRAGDVAPAPPATRGRTRR